MPHPYIACPLDHRAKRVLGLFARGELIKSSNVANMLGISPRQVRELLSKWAGQGGLKSLIGIARIMHPGEGGSID